MRHEEKTLNHLPQFIQYWSAVEIFCLNKQLRALKSFFLTVLHVSHIKACYVQPVVRATLCKTVMQQWIMPSNVVRKHENWPTFLMHSHLCEFDFGIPNRWRELSHAVTYLLHCDAQTVVSWREVVDVSVRYLSKAERYMYGGQNGSTTESISIAECWHFIIFIYFGNFDR